MKQNSAATITGKLSRRITNRPFSLIRVVRHGHSDPQSKELRDLFDRPSTWIRDQSGSPTGLFGYSILGQHNGFLKATESTIIKCNEIIQKVCAASEPSEIAKTVKRLDRLSDMVCSVLDAAQLIRSVHHSEQICMEADQAHSILDNYLNQLNTHFPLYQALKQVVDDPTVYKSLNPQALRVANLLIDDFEKSGVHMAENEKKMFVDLTDRIRELGHQVMENAGPSAEYIRFENPHEDLLGVPKHFTDNINKDKQGHGLVSTDSILSQMILKLARKEASRQKTFMALNSADQEQLDILQELLKTRRLLAKHLGKESYSHLYLADKMAKTPGNT